MSPSEREPSTDSLPKSSGPVERATAFKLRGRCADNRLIQETSPHIYVSSAARAPRRLHICTRCESELIQPSEWEDAGEDRWLLRLHCPNCGWSHRGTFSSAQLTALEDHLDRGFDVLLCDLKRLTAANMTEEIERLGIALERELILPEDF